MRLTMDTAGRIVLPKPIRERMGLKGGMEIEVTEGPEGLTLRPVDHKPSLERRGDLLVYVGGLPGGFGVVEAVDDDREARMRKVLGL